MSRRIKKLGVARGKAGKGRRGGLKNTPKTSSYKHGLDMSKTYYEHLHKIEFLDLPKILKEIPEMVKKIGERDKLEQLKKE